MIVTYYFKVFQFIFLLEQQIFLQRFNWKFPCWEILFSFPFNPTKALEKQQRDTLLSNSLEIEGLSIYFAKEPHRPQVTNSLVYIEVINFFVDLSRAPRLVSNGTTV